MPAITTRRAALVGIRKPTVSRTIITRPGPAGSWSVHWAGSSAHSPSASRPGQVGFRAAPGSGRAHLLQGGPARPVTTTRRARPDRAWPAGDGRVASAPAPATAPTTRHAGPRPARAGNRVRPRRGQGQRGTPPGRASKPAAAGRAGAADSTLRRRLIHFGAAARAAVGRARGIVGADCRRGGRPHVHLHVLPHQRGGIQAQVLRVHAQESPWRRRARACAGTHRLHELQVLQLDAGLGGRERQRRPLALARGPQGLSYAFHRVCRYLRCSPSLLGTSPSRSIRISRGSAPWAGPTTPFCSSRSMMRAARV
jgi:hypothetical protein